MARITSLGLKNFKTIGASLQEINIAPITLLFGPNSAGKSTVLQSLIYLREIVCKRNLNPDQTELGGSWLDLGGFKNLVHGHDLDEAIEISAEIALDNEELPGYLSSYEQDMLDEFGLPAVADFFSEISSAKVTLRLRWSNSLNCVVVERYECWLNNNEVAQISSALDGRQIIVERLALASDGLQAAVEAFPDSVPFSQFLNDLINASVVIRSTIELYDSRLLKDKSIGDLEQLIETDDLPPRQLLDRLKTELKHRSSRRAHNLGTKVDNLLEQYDAIPTLEFIGLHHQRDALPDIKLGLEFDSEVWQEQEEQIGIHQAHQHLAMAVINAAVCGPLHCLSEWLDDLSYIGPLRDLPPRNILPRSTPDKSRWAKGIAAWELLPTAKTSLIEEMNFWLGEECLDSGYQLLVKKYRELEDSHPLYRMLDDELELDDLAIIKELLEDLPHKVRVCLKEESSGLEVMPQDIGVGISQLFPVIALSVIQKSGLVSIEQPELHIHPRLQVELADVFVRYAKQSNAMFLLETHSEHLILRLLRRVRQATEQDNLPDIVTLEPDDLAVHYVEPTDAGTEFKKLRVSSDGDFIDEWPHGFFDERDEELF